MTFLKILQYPDSRLRKKGHKVSDVHSPEIKKIINDMHETLSNTENCAGLSATQLDIDKPPSIFVINTSDHNVLCLINPQITAKEGSEVGEEGCMSIYPDYISAEVKRAVKIKVEGLDILGNKVDFETDGQLARCIQHELDHLNGVLYIDYLPKSKRTLLEKKMQEYCFPPKSRRKSTRKR